MNCYPFGGTGTRAMKRYTQGVALTMSGYVLTVFGTTHYARNHPPHGVTGYLLAAIPSACIVAMLGVVVRYLHEETDEYQRMLVGRSILISTFVLLAISCYSDFLRSFEIRKALPPFFDFVTFWIIFAASQGVQALIARAGSHE